MRVWWGTTDVSSIRCQYCFSLSSAVAFSGFLCFGFPCRPRHIQKREKAKEPEAVPKEDGEIISKAHYNHRLPEQQEPEFRISLNTQNGRRRREEVPFQRAGGSCIQKNLGTNPSCMLIVPSLDQKTYSQSFMLWSSHGWTNAMWCTKVLAGPPISNWICLFHETQHGGHAPDPLHKTM